MMRPLRLWFLTFLLFLFSLTYVDYIVHYNLYSYGLQFSLDWAKPYWFALNIVFLSAALNSAYSFQLRATSKRQDRYLAFLIFFTILMSSLGGFLDFFWWVIHGSLPALDFVWHWSPFYWLFNFEWTTKHQLIYTLAWFLALTVLWITYGLLSKRSNRHAHVR